MNVLKSSAKPLLRLLGRVPGFRKLWLESVRVMFCYVTLPPRLRDVLMWDVATYILGEDYEELVQLNTGPTMIVGMDDNVSRSILFYSRFRNHVWEPHTLCLVERLVRPVSTVIIAGAHIGYCALHLGRSVKEKGGRVFAFEPVEKFYRRCEQNLSMSQVENVILERAILDSESAQEKAIYVMGAQSSIDMKIARKHRAVEKVRSVSLDEYAELRNIERVDLIWLDVEGNELNVLEGGQLLLRSRPDLVLEVNLDELRKAGREERAIYRFLYEHGYTVYAILGDYPPAFRDRACKVVDLKPILADDSNFGTNTTITNILATCHPERLRHSGISVVGT